MNNEEKLEEITKLMRKIGITDNGVGGNYRPIKDTTKTDCYNTLGKIQEILETNGANMYDTD